MSYVKSEYIRIFPYGQDRPNTEANGKILNESNLVSLRTSVTDEHSYAINFSDNLNTGLAVLEFVLGGYYVLANIIDLITATKMDSEGTPIVDWNDTISNVWVSCTISSENTLTGGDVLENGESTFQGINFHTNGEPTGCTFKLKLLEYVSKDVGFRIPLESKVKFKAVSLADPDVIESSFKATNN